VAGEIGVNQTWIPRRDILVRQLQSLAHSSWRVDDHHIRPFDEPFENLSRAGGFQIHSHSAFVAIVQMPGIVVLGAGLRRDLEYNFLQVAPWGFTLDYVSAKIRQNYPPAPARARARHSPPPQPRRGSV